MLKGGRRQQPNYSFVNSSTTTFKKLWRGQPLNFLKTAVLESTEQYFGCRCQPPFSINIQIYSSISFWNAHSILSGTPFPDAEKYAKHAWTKSPSFKFSDKVTNDEKDEELESEAEDPVDEPPSDFPAPNDGSGSESGSGSSTSSSSDDEPAPIAPVD